MGESLPRPEGFLQKERYEYYTCICHGDLNVDNIFVEESVAEPILIDFHESGRGHVFCDFVVFENSLRSTLQSDLTFNELLQEEISLHESIRNATEVSFDDDYFEYIRDIRLKARSIFPEAKYGGYVYGLTMSLYGLLRSFKPRVNDDYYRKIFAAFVAGMYYLEKYDLERLVKKGNEKNNFANLEDQSQTLLSADEEEYDAFISFNSKSRDYIREVVKCLKSKGLKIWFDEDILVAGTELVQSISRGIESAKTFIIICGDYDSGKWQAKEIGQIVYNKIESSMNKITVVPAIVPNSQAPIIPAFLKNFMYVELSEDTVQACIQLQSIIENARK